jgi:hypothetical protein
LPLFSADSRRTRTWVCSNFVKRVDVGALGSSAFRPDMLRAGNLTDDAGVLTLLIRRTRNESRVRERSVQLPADAATLLRRYWARERLQASQCAAQAAIADEASSPLFWTLGRHGRCRRTRITGHAVNYWLEQLRRRMGLEQRLTARSLTKPVRQASLVLR